MLADAGYGIDTAFRIAVRALGLTYVVGIQSSTSLWPPGSEPLPPKAWSGRGRPPSLVRRNPQHKPVSAEELAQALPEAPGTASPGGRARISARLPLRRRAHQAGASGLLAHRTATGGMVLGRVAPGQERTDQILALHFARRTTLADLVDQAKLRWRIERDYQKLKQEIGLGHYEGRGWRGFHHHATLAIAAYGFLVSERSLDSPSDRPSPSLLEAPRLSEDLPTPRNPRHDPSATTSTRSPPFALASPMFSHAGSRDVSAAYAIYDTVRLAIATSLSAAGGVPQTECIQSHPTKLTSAETTASKVPPPRIKTTDSQKLLIEVSRFLTLPVWGRLSVTGNTACSSLRSFSL